MVLPGVAETTRVCTYDRPGTFASISEDNFPSRSDAISPAPHRSGGGRRNSTRCSRRLMSRPLCAGRPLPGRLLRAALCRHLS